AVKNALFISGDIHASFASVEGGVPCLTAPAISSFAFKPGIAEAVGAVVGPTSNVYRYAVTEMEQTFKEANPGMAFAEASSHGYVTLEVKSATEAEATFHLLPAAEVETDYSTRPGQLAAKVTEKRFRVKDGAITALA
ncbi:MAG: putative alkaline phosphatase, partial [Labilithrix sp.]|nr:putative alkaline phosphatase [Labilithrix sp.]